MIADRVHLEAVLHGGGEVREVREGAGSSLNFNRKNKCLKRTALVGENNKKNLEGQ